MFSKYSIFLLIFHLITIILALTLVETVQGFDGNEGDSCFINGTLEEGICTRKLDCEKPCAAEVKEFELCKKTPRGKMPIVCCPKVRPTMSISGKKCLEYKELACNRHYVGSGIFDKPIVSKVSTCARNTQPVIIGGEEAQKREFPHMALLRWADDENIACGGILISDQFVLSAAHCFNNTRHGPPSFIRLGEHDQNNENESEHIDVQIDKFIPYRSYDKEYFYDDIGLIKLERPVNFTDAIRPACLPEEPITDDIVNATAAGWGYGERIQPSNVLMKVDLKLFDHNRCRDYVTPNNRSPQGYLSASQVCAGSETHKNNTCGGDSGGPLQVTHKYHYCTDTIIGVTSFGKACERARNHSIGVYTRVYPYLSWIESIVWPESVENAIK